LPFDKASPKDENNNNNGPNIIVFLVEGVLMETKNGGDQCRGIEYACSQ
jgi:hypothetical protein